MKTFLQDRCAHHRQCSLALLAPVDETLGQFRGELSVSREVHSHLIAETQRFRGGVYLADGAIQPHDLDAKGRHIQPADSRSWHLVMLDPMGRVIGCTRFRRHAGQVSWGQLSVRQAPIAESQEWGLRFRESVDAELAAARRAGFSYVEVGGWALANEIRGTFWALKTVLAIYAWSQLLGGALAITTATERNKSARMLRRLGGRPLACGGAELPAYYDQRYRCKMEVLRFDSREPNAKFRDMLDELREQVATAPIFCSEPLREDRHRRRLPQPFPLFESEVAC
jgi:hypothetical protein